MSKAEQGRGILKIALESESEGISMDCGPQFLGKRLPYLLCVTDMPWVT